MTTPMINTFEKVIAATEIQKMWRGFSQRNQGKIRDNKICMDCGGLANCSTTHDNVPRCEYCEKCYTDEKEETEETEETEYWMKLQEERDRDFTEDRYQSWSVYEKPDRRMAESWMNQEQIEVCRIMMREKYSEGFDDGEKYAEETAYLECEYTMKEKEQQIYDSGLIDGRSIANEELRMLREQLALTQAQLGAALQTIIELNKCEKPKQNKSKM